MTKYKVVLDTNIYLSAIIFGGNSRHILDLVIDKKLQAISSPSILLEISKKLKEKFFWNKEQIVLVIKTIVKDTKVVYPKLRLNIVKKDKSDNKIIEAAEEGGANYIITGDKHLLDLKQIKKIKIATPAKLLSVFFKKNKVK